MIGKQISPILSEIEGALWDFEMNGGSKPEYDKDGFRASIKIFMSVIMDKMWELQENESLSIEDRCNMANKVGEDIRKLVKTYTDIDTHDLYK
jgi:hypothetical protein